MQKLLYKTKNGGSPQDKPRVYFTCHPDDFERTFSKICDDFFKNHECVIFYTENMTELLPENTRELDLGRMNMFVVPVTFKLMTTPNRANDFDLRFAKDRNIVILPIMFETGIDSIYSRPENFGNRQYLAPFEHDLTAISYEEKLNKYLESTLFDDKTVERIRKTFDAYIFLSYRKMDRVYANDLIKLLHSEPRFRDLAIWYDEFLTPGDPFDKEIEKTLSLSKLFAMVVTPNLVKYTPDGKPNYVMMKEYPKAKETVDFETGEKLHILPIQVADMSEADCQALVREFKDIPDSVDGHELNELSNAVYENLKNVAINKNDSPEHNYLIGLAYLEGIDVEVDQARALNLITSAAEDGLIEAIYRIYSMYLIGIGVEINYSRAGVWAEKLVSSSEKEYGRESPFTLSVLHELAYIYGELGLYEKAISINEELIQIYKRNMRNDYSDMLSSLGNLAYDYCKTGNLQKALELSEYVYQERCNICGEDNLHTIIALNNLAKVYMYADEKQKATDLLEKAYCLSQKVLGDESQTTILILHNFAHLHLEEGKKEEAIREAEKAYGLRCKTLGKAHPDTLSSSVLLAKIYSAMSKFERALSFAEEAYQTQCKVFGEKSPVSISTLIDIAIIQFKSGAPEASENMAKAYELSREILGDSDSLTVNAYEWTILLEHHATYKKAISYATIFFRNGDFQNSIEILEHTLDYVNGPYSIITSTDEKLIHLNLLSLAEQNTNSFEKALLYAEAALTLATSKQFDDCRFLFSSVLMVSSLQSKLGLYEEAKNTLGNLYNMQCEKYGCHHPETLITLGYLSKVCVDSGDVEKGVRLYMEEYTYIHQILSEDNSPHRRLIISAWDIFLEE